MGKEECIFCSLANDGSRTIYEDKLCYVVPDKFPTSPGHMLVISKPHYRNVTEAPDDLVSHMFLIAKKMGTKAMDKLEAVGLNIGTNTGKEAGQIIFHFHIHVIPRYFSQAKGFVTHKEITDQEIEKLKSSLKS